MGVGQVGENVQLRAQGPELLQLVLLAVLKHFNCYLLVVIATTVHLKRKRKEERRGGCLGMQ